MRATFDIYIVNPEKVIIYEEVDSGAYYRASNYTKPVNS